jgi:hypothetical protein
VSCHVVCKLVEGTVRDKRGAGKGTYQISLIREHSHGMYAQTIDSLRMKGPDNSASDNKTVNLIIAMVILALLAAPIFTMYKLSSMDTERTTYGALGVLMVFSLIFAATMSMLTAAYCAVLIVFIGSQTN